MYARCTRVPTEHRTSVSDTCLTTVTLHLTQSCSLNSALLCALIPSKAERGVRITQLSKRAEGHETSLHSFSDSCCYYKLVCVLPCACLFLSRGGGGGLGSLELTPGHPQNKGMLSFWNPGQKQNYFLQRKVETREGLWLGEESQVYNASLGCSGFGTVCVPPCAGAQTQTHEEGWFLPFRHSHMLLAVFVIWKSIQLTSFIHKDLQSRTQTVPLWQ